MPEKMSVDDARRIGRWLDHVERIVREVQEAVIDNDATQCIKLSIDLKSYAEMMKRDALDIDRRRMKPPPEVATVSKQWDAQKGVVVVVVKRQHGGTISFLSYSDAVDYANRNGIVLQDADSPY